MKPVEILLVEDNPGDVLLTRKAFERSKIANTLSVVTDGHEALEYLYRRGEYADAARPDLVLLDINLPRVSGQEVLETVKQDPVLCTIPVVMLTSSDRELDVLAAYASHANSYVSKPPDLRQLADAVSGLEQYWFMLVRRPKQPKA